MALIRKLKVGTQTFDIGGGSLELLSVSADKGVLDSNNYNKVAQAPHNFVLVYGGYYHFFTYESTNELVYASAPYSADNQLVHKFIGITKDTRAYECYEEIFSHDSYTELTGKPAANQTPAFGGSVTVSQIISDTQGHVSKMNDKTITIPATLSNGTGTAGLIKTTSTVTATSGYTSCPVIDGVPYYKDTNTHNSHSVSSGMSATNVEIKGTSSNGDLKLGDSGVTATVYGPTENQTPSYGSTFSVPSITVNAKGIVTSATTHTVKIPASDNTNTTYKFDTGTINGTFQVTPSNGTVQAVSIKGLGSAAYTASTAYASAGHNHDSAYAPKGHNHDSAYATTGHTHSGYASSNHNHDGTYLKSAPVTSVNNKTGAVWLTASDVGAAASTHNHAGTYATTGHTHSASEIGALSATISIPTVHNATLTITQNNTPIGTFSANQSTATTINISIPVSSVNGQTGSVNLTATHLNMTGYKIATTTSSIATTDSISGAIGKLDAHRNVKASASSFGHVKLEYDKDSKSLYITTD